MMQVHDGRGGGGGGGGLWNEQVLFNQLPTNTIQHATGFHLDVERSSVFVENTNYGFGCLPK